MGKLPIRFKDDEGEKEGFFSPDVVNLDLISESMISIDLAPLSICANMEELRIFSNKMKKLDLSPLSSCSSLQLLSIRGTQLKKLDLSPLSSCSSLETLSLQNNQLQELDLSPLSNCGSLEILLLGGNQLKKVDLSPLSSCSSLQKIGIASNQLQEVDISPLSSCSSLQSCGILDNPGIQIVMDERYKNDPNVPKVLRKAHWWKHVIWRKSAQPIAMPIKKTEVFSVKPADSRPPFPERMQESPPSDDLTVLRGCEVVGGKFQYKIKMKNVSKYVITNICTNIAAHPENLKLEIDRSKEMPRIEPSGFGALEYTFLPTRDCVEGKIQATVSYIDHLNELHTTNVEPYIIRSVCDLLRPLDMALDQFDSLLENLDKTNQELTMDWNAEVFFKRINTLVQLRNFRVIESQYYTVGNQFIGTIKGIAQGKYTEKRVAIVILVNGHSEGQQCSVTVEVLAEDEAMLAVTLQEMLEDIRPLIEMIPSIKQDTEGLLAGLENFSEEQTLLIRKTIDSVHKAMRLIDSSLEVQQQQFDTISSNLERVLEDLNVPRGKIDRVKKALKGGLKDGIKEVGKIALRELVRFVVRI